MTIAEGIWLGVGVGGQALFFSRFALQWRASERARRSVVPVAFWWCSLGGGALLFAFAIHRGEPVFAVGQAGGLAIYARNLWLIRRERGRPPAA